MEDKKNNTPNFSKALLSLVLLIIVWAIVGIFLGLFNPVKAEAASYTQDFDGMATNDSISTLTNWSVVADGGSCQARTTFADSAPNSMSCIDDDAIFEIDTQLGAWSTLSVYYSWYLNAGTFYDTPTRFQDAGGAQDLTITYREDGAIYFFDNTAGDVCGGNETVEAAGFNADNTWADFRVDINKTANTFSLYDGLGTQLLTRSCTFVDTIEEWENAGHSTQQTYIDNFEAYSDGSAPIPPGVGTRVVEIISPIDGETTASTTVEFEVDYISDIPVPDRICFNIIDYTFGQSLVPLCQTITISGDLTFSTTTVLTTGHSYSVQVKIWDSENAVISQSNGSVFFSVVTPQMSIYDPSEGWGVPTSVGPITGTSTPVLCEIIDTGIPRAFCNLAAFLFLPDQQALERLDAAYAHLESKRPLSILDEFSEAWSGIDFTSKPSASFDWQLNFLGHEQTIPIVSTTTFNGVWGDDSSGTIRGWIAVGLWVAMAFFLYRRVTNLI